MCWQASVPAGLNPNLVHVGGGAQLSVYGSFYGHEDIWLLAQDIFDLKNQDSTNFVAFTVRLSVWVCGGVCRDGHL